MHATAMERSSFFARGFIRKSKPLLTTAWLWLLVCLTANASTVTYVYTDTHGTTLAEADQNGAIIATYDYRPYGALALGQVPAGPGYAGHVNDPDTGLLYMQARYYDPAAGRFLSADPIALRAGDDFAFNRFAYADNNPNGLIDPDGRDPQSPWYQRAWVAVRNFLNSPAAMRVERAAAQGVIAAESSEGSPAEALVEADISISQAEMQVMQLESKAQAVRAAQSPVVVGGVKVGNTPTQARQALQEAGHEGTPVTNNNGTETGTIHSISDKNMDVRVMDGGPNHGPRIVTNRTGNPNQLVDPQTGKNFGNIPLKEQRERAHIPLNGDQ